MQSDSNNYVSVHDDAITELVHSLNRHVLDRDLHRQLEIFNEWLQKASFDLMRRCDVCLE